jgi:hypothetical protein
MTDHLVGDPDAGRPRTENDDPLLGRVPARARHIEQPRQHDGTIDGGKRRMMIASLRNLDTFVKMDGAWLFAERKLCVDWGDDRALS